MRKVQFSIFVFGLLFLTACATNNKGVQQTRLNAITADIQNTQQFAIQLLNLLGSSGANSLVNIQAHEGRPITIDAKSFTVNAPLDLEAIFNSAAFRRDYGKWFPQTKNGWDAFIKVVEVAGNIASRDTPWLAGVLKSAINKAGNTFEGNNNSVATNESTIDNSDNSDSSDNSDNSRRGIETVPIDPSVTPVQLGATTTTTSESESTSDSETTSDGETTDGDGTDDTETTTNDSEESTI